jgi:hypothetical protein
LFHAAEAAFEANLPMRKKNLRMGDRQEIVHVRGRKPEFTISPPSKEFAGATFWDASEYPHSEQADQKAHQRSPPPKWAA